MATTTKTFTTAGLGTWICPPGVTAIQAEVWGAGGGGGVSTAAEGGGGGGAYAIGSSFPVSASSSYTFQVGASGAAGASGGSSWFNGTTSVFGPGGIASPGTTGGAGGTAGIGTPARAGGQGGAAGGTLGGGGGGGAAANSGVGGIGAAPTGTVGGVGGTAGVGAGAGGHGGNQTAAGTSGVAPGGGGAGGGTGANAGAGANGRVVLTYTTPLTQSLTEDFSGAAIDLTKWGSVTINQGTPQQSGGQLQVFTKPSVNNSEGDWNSIETYDLTASYLMAQINQVSTNTVETQVNFISPGGNDGLQFKQSNGTLIGNTVVGGVGTNQGTALYNGTTMVWWRIREAAGTTYWEYSQDARGWTNLGSVANKITMTSGTVQLSVFESPATATPGTSLFDNVNNPPVSQRTFKTLTGVGQ